MYAKFCTPHIFLNTNTLSTSLFVFSINFNLIAYSNTGFISFAISNSFFDILFFSSNSIISLSYIPCKLIQNVDEIPNTYSKLFASLGDIPFFPFTTSLICLGENPVLSANSSCNILLFSKTSFKVSPGCIINSRDNPFIFVSMII